VEALCQTYLKDRAACGCSNRLVSITPAVCAAVGGFSDRSCLIAKDLPDGRAPLYPARWRAHFEFTRLNTTRTILRKKIEEARGVGAFSCPVRRSVSDKVHNPPDASQNLGSLLTAAVLRVNATHCRRISPCSWLDSIGLRDDD
jgi:hypothetical protein